MDTVTLVTIVLGPVAVAALIGAVGYRRRRQRPPSAGGRRRRPPGE